MVASSLVVTSGIVVLPIAAGIAAGIVAALFVGESLSYIEDRLKLKGKLIKVLNSYVEESALDEVDRIVNGHSAMKSHQHIRNSAIRVY